MIHMERIKNKYEEKKNRFLYKKISLRTQKKYERRNETTNLK